MVAQDNSESIADSSITWTRVVGDIQQRYDTTAVAGPNRQVEVLSGTGYVSKCAILTFDWTEDADRLPSKGLMKIVSVGTLTNLSNMNGSFVRFDELADAMTNAEFVFYAEAHKSDFIKKVPIPGFICGGAFGVDGCDAGYLILELLTDIHHRHVFDELEESTLREAVQVLARVAAFSLRRAEVVARMVHRHMFIEFFRDFAREQIEDGFVQMQRHFPHLGRALDLLKSRRTVFESAEVFEREMLSACLSCPSSLSQPGKRPTIVHGDMWSGNMLFDNVGDDAPYTVKSVVDWQTAHIGNPLEDVARFFFKAMTAKRDFFLKVYFDTMKEEADGAELPWDSVEELTEQFERIMPLIVIIWIPPFIICFDNPLLLKSDAESKRKLELLQNKFSNAINESGKYIQKWYPPSDI